MEELIKLYDELNKEFFEVTKEANKLNGGIEKRMKQGESLALARVLNIINARIKELE